MPTEVQARVHRPPHEVYDPAEGPLLIVRLGAIGDVIRALPALDLLRQVHPVAQIDWLVEEKSADLLRGHRHLRRVILFRRREVMRGVRRLHLVAAARAIRGCVGELKEARYAVVLDLQGSLKSAVLSRATGCPDRIGLAAGHSREGAHVLYTRTVDPGNERISRVERNFRMVAPLGAGLPDPSRPPHAWIVPTEIDRSWAAGVLASLAPAGGPRVLLYPGTSLRQAYKRWPPERYGWLAGRLRDDGIQVLVAGGPGEEAIVEEVRRATSTPPPAVPPSSLMQLAAVFEKVDLFVGGDTGPMHLAWAAGTRVLGLFGATDPIINAPYDPDRVGHRVLYRGAAERPYRVKGERARRWMEAIDVDEVHAACREMLDAAPGGRE